jgi:hypothetical protein
MIENVERCLPAVEGMYYGLFDVVQLRWNAVISDISYS